MKECKLTTDNIVSIACGAAAAVCAISLVAVRKTAAPWVKALLGIGMAGGLLGTAVSVVGCRKCYDRLKSVKVWSFPDDSCSCGPDCSCGCQEGQPCTCQDENCGAGCDCGCQEGQPCTCEEEKTGE